MKKMKKFCLSLLLLLCCAATASASILPATGVNEDFKAWTGIECQPAVVLCESLSILDNRGDQGGRKVGSILYTGKEIPVIESWDGYAKIYYSDGTETGWVANDYLLFDPAWYVCDQSTPVYAYPDGMAPRVALLDKGTKLPIITEYDDNISVGGWVCVSLRGAAGWICKTPADTAGNTWFRPDNLQNIQKAQLTVTNAVPILCTDPAKLNTISDLLTHAEDKGGMMAGCPFTATLTLWLLDGTQVDLQLATDSCCIYRIDGRDYAYARHLVTDEANPSNDLLFSLFGVNMENLWGF